MILPIILLSIKTAAPVARVCEVNLPSSLTKYALRVEKRFGKIRCVVGLDDEASVQPDGTAVVIVESEDHKFNLPIVAHEMLHLWLGTQGWDVSAGHSTSWSVEGHPEGGQHEVNELADGLEDYIEHRIITPIMLRNGVSEHKELVSMAAGFIKEQGARYDPPAVGLEYLFIKLGDVGAGLTVKRFLTVHHCSLALDAAAEMETIISKQNPRTQDVARKTVQLCLDAMFAKGSPYLNAAPYLSVAELRGAAGDDGAPGESKGDLSPLWMWYRSLNIQ